MTAEITVIRNDGTQEHAKPPLIEQVEMRMILNWYAMFARVMEQHGIAMRRQPDYTLVKRLATSIGEGEQFPD